MTVEDKRKMESIPFGLTMSTVDIIVQVQHRGIVMITKKGSSRLYLPGGFEDPSDLTPTHAARREALEEIGIELTLLAPLRVKDGEGYRPHIADKGRYDNGSKHTIKSRVFTSKISEQLAEQLKAGDDANSINIIPIEKFLDLKWALDNMSSSHLPIIMYYLGRKNLL